MPQLFESTEINHMILINRFVRSATWEAMAGDKGEATLTLIHMMAELAKGGVGLIISGHAYVAKEGQAGARQLGVYDDSLVPGLTEIADAVHGENGKIVLQLAHAGGLAEVDLTGQPALGPSAFENQNGTVCKEMTKNEIQDAVRAFGEAAFRAKKAGFDGVQIHAAHGYCLSQFLSPFFNRRTDDYGGPLKNRVRVVLQVLAEIRAQVGDDYPVLIKMNSEDFLEKGLSQDEMLDFAEMLQHAGIDAIELSGGTGFSGKFHPIRKGNGRAGEKVYYLDAASRFKSRLSVPLMLVGGIRSYETAQNLVEKGLADYISLCRPLIREPGLIHRWKQGDLRPSTCVSDNLCFLPTREGKGIYCVTEEKTTAK